MTKYIGPKTDGENVATQADKLSLSSETPDALTPDQTGAAGTATTAARSDHQHEILAGAAGTITGTNAEGSSTSLARADHDHALGTGVVGTAELASAVGNFGAFTSYTPTLTASTTNPTLGTGSTQSGWYIQIGKLVIANFLIRFGTSGASAGSGNYRISLPVTASSNMSGGSAETNITTGTVRVGGVAPISLGAVRFNTTTTVEIVYVSDTGALALVTNSQPGTWTNGHHIHGQMIYEAA